MGMQSYTYLGAYVIIHITPCQMVPGSTYKKCPSNHQKNYTLYDKFCVDCGKALVITEGEPVKPSIGHIFSKMDGLNFLFELHRDISITDNKVLLGGNKFQYDMLAGDFFEETNYVNLTPTDIESRVNAFHKDYKKILAELESQGYNFQVVFGAVQYYI